MVVALLAAGILFAASVASASSLAWAGRGHPRVAAKALSLRAPTGRLGSAGNRTTTRSCAADRKHSAGPAGWRLLPVACEQPPRSNLLLQLDWASLAGLFG